MSHYDWSRYEGSRWAPEKVGDSISGWITEIRDERTQNGTIPVVVLGDKEVFVSQTFLQQELAKFSPQVGDGLKITLTELRNTGKPSPMKVFEVEHRDAATRGQQTQEPSPPATVDADDLQDYADGEEPF